MTKYSVSKAPKTDAEGYDFVLQQINKSDLARKLNISKQLVSRWKVVPTQYVVQVSEITLLPIGYILPELERAVSNLLNRPSEKLLPQLIKLLNQERRSAG